MLYRLYNIKFQILLVINDITCHIFVCNLASFAKLVVKTFSSCFDVNCISPSFVLKVLKDLFYGRQQKDGENKKNVGKKLLLFINVIFICEMLPTSKYCTHLILA